MIPQLKKDYNSTKTTLKLKIKIVIIHWLDPQDPGYYLSNNSLKGGNVSYIFPFIQIHLVHICLWIQWQWNFQWKNNIIKFNSP